MDRSPAPIPARLWGVLAASVLVAAASATVTAGVAFLIPALHDDRGMRLTTAGVLVAMPVLGTAVSLIAWGALVDRIGERIVLAAGAGAAALAVAGAAAARSPVATGAWFLLAGAASAAAHSASGRVVVGWFPVHRRGLAMGIRQMAQPLGAAIGAISMPLLARAHGVSAALLVPLALNALAALVAWVCITDPPRPARQAPGSGALVTSPYRGARYLPRIHSASVLLVAPQALMQTYLLVWLVVGHRWDPASAGVVVTVAQIAGAAGRIAVGALSDRTGSRMRPLRLVAVAGIAGSLGLAGAEAWGAPGALAVTLAVAVTVISTADNGLAFTAVAEYAGPFWSGRALGIQNTSQFLMVAASTPLLAAVIEHAGYAATFALSGVLAAVALPMVPRADVRRASVPEPAGAGTDARRGPSG